MEYKYFVAAVEKYSGYAGIVSGITSTAVMNAEVRGTVKTTEEHRKNIVRKKK